MSTVRRLPTQMDLRKLAPQVRVEPWKHTTARQAALTALDLAAKGPRIPRDIPMPSAWEEVAAVFGWVLFILVVAALVAILAGPAALVTGILYACWHAPGAYERACAALRRVRLHAWARYQRLACAASVRWARWNSLPAPVPAPLLLTCDLQACEWEAPEIYVPTAAARIQEAARRLRMRPSEGRQLAALADAQLHRIADQMREATAIAVAVALPTLALILHTLTGV